MSSKVKLIQRNSSLLKIKEIVTKLFNKKRIQCVIVYGSFLNKDRIKPKDIDILVLLDRYEFGDLSCFKKVKSASNYEFFIDYKDQILRKGINNYQRGRHGVYFFKILAYGKCIIGSNLYLENIKKINEDTVHRDLLFRIEEYFYRIQKHCLNNRKSDFNYIIKYISRIILDLLLFYNVISFTDINKIHYTKMIDQYICYGNLFSVDIINKIQKMNRYNHNVLLPEIIGEMYNAYMKAFDKFNERRKSKQYK